MISSLQQSLDAMKDKLSSSGEKLQEYITAVNQELSSSLHVIHEESRMLADRKVSGIKAAMQGTIDRVVALSREMILKVDQLRDYSIAYRSDGEILVEQFYLVEPLQEVMWDIEKIRTDRKVQIDFEIPKGMPPAYADIPKFKSILRNLLMRAATGNGDTVTVLVKANLIPYSWLREKAADFMPPYVEESLRHDCDIVLISVSDDGPALVEEQPGSLFEPELSGDKVNFGLAVAKNFVEIHGGQIWYERTAEERNRFSFYLPLISEDRRVFMNYMTKRIKQAKDQISCLSVIVVAFRNLDFLREEQGEEQFMRVLKDVERVVKGTIREPMDTLRKYRGGEIFAIFAETERAGTRAMRERLERAITEYSGVRGPKLSFKMTTATYPDDAATTEMMLEVLDREVELDL
jgi:GGDEF domain-containing protein